MKSTNIAMLKISISIVIYKEDQDTLQRLINSINAIEFNKEVIIIDNSPQNNLKDFINSYKHIKYKYIGTNVGFGKAHNIAFNLLNTKSDIHLVLNPDIFFEKNQIESFLKWFHHTNNISLAIPKVLNLDGTIQQVVREIPMPISLIKRKIFNNYGELTIKDNLVSNIPFAHGCFLAFKPDIFKKINGFDERFFMYMEDVDIWIRVKKYGKTVINTNYSIYHEHRKASSKKLKLLLLHAISAVKFFWKYRQKLNT